MQCVLLGPGAFRVQPTLASNSNTKSNDNDNGTCTDYNNILLLGAFGLQFTLASSSNTKSDDIDNMKRTRFLMSFPLTVAIRKGLLLRGLLTIIVLNTF